MVRAQHPRMPHVGHDQALQPREQSDEDPGGHQTRILRDISQQLSRPEGDEFDRNT